jgi:hypothetical protein
MSEIAEAAAPAAEPVESAPSSTADIATSVLAELEGADAGTTAEAERGDADPSPGVVDPPPAPTQAEMSAAAKFLLAQGHKAKTTDGRDSWLKHSTVEKMLDRYVETHRGEWTGARGVIESELKEARGHLEQLRAGVSGDPKAFIAELASLDPRYRAFLEPPAAAPAAVAPSAGMPQPDLPLPDGGRTYSVEGLQQLIEWAVDARMMPKVDERLKPYAEREREQQAAAERAKATSALEASTRQQMTEAQSWPNFGALAPDGTLTPFQQEVLTELANDTAKARAANRRPTMTLRQAYLEVHTRTVAKDTRQSTLQQLKAAPKVPTLGRTGGEPPKVKPASTLDIARSIAAEYDRA